jgi:acetylornithine deacetylase/succinyl-diaminopimelate desuccinylase-like protein
LPGLFVAHGRHLTFHLPFESHSISDTIKENRIRNLLPQKNMKTHSFSPDDSLRIEVLALCQQLIQTPSVNGLHDELHLAHVIAAFARAHDLDVEMTALDAQRPNVLVRVGPPDIAAGLLLVGHMDTVPVGEAACWQHDPFGAELHNGRLYGRGAIDNKGGIAAALGALVLLKQLGKRLRRPVLLACVPDEESGATGHLGIKYLQASGKLSGQGAIYVYPDMHRTAIGHRGVLRFKLTARGQSFHTGGLEWQDADHSLNAVTGMSAALLALEALTFESQPQPPIFAPYRTVLTPTLVQGGAGVSIVPDHCEAFVDIRLVPGTPREMVETRVRQAINAVLAERPQLRLELQETAFIPPTVIAEDAVIVGAVQHAVQEVRGIPPEIFVSGPANESYLLNDYGIPTLTLGPDGQGAHAVDEYVEVDSLYQVLEIYARVGLALGKTA